MRLVYYKPQINANSKLAEYQANKESLHAIYLNLVDGERTADDIAKMLLINGHMIGDIITVMNELQQGGIISEAPTSDLGIFDSQELDNLEQQLNALSMFNFDKKGMFMPYSPSSLSHQKRIKEAKIMVVGHGENARRLITELTRLGFGEIQYYIYGTEKVIEDEDNTIKALNTVSHDYTDIYIHKNFNNELDTDIISRGNTDIVVYIEDDFSEKTAIQINDICRQNQKDFIPFQISFPKVYVGPFYIYKQTSCYKCYQIRKDAARASYAPVSPQASNAQLNIVFGVDLLCLELVKYYSYITDMTTVDNVWAFDIVTGKTSYEPVFKIPRCPICGVSKIKPTKKLWENI